MQTFQLGPAPLRGEDAQLWGDLLKFWELGLRTQAVAAADSLAVRLNQCEQGEREAFGHWLCGQLFDTKPSQLQGAGQGRVPYPFGIYPLAVGIVIPQLKKEMQAPTGRTLRWLYQAVVGLGGRLTPAARLELNELVERVCGGEANILLLLRLAAKDDARAALWLAGIEASEHPCGPLWLPYD